ncbi:MAG: hypothetical protein DYG94_07430 [Leptolyngbya sp. PLA3]|nr:MAG: hypothetical protein EDM82_06555 [Cyanobacteria bacterium CYA]MCE7968561.1 hypothetical protein [Leptolyngbya sp. PL-A3]
MSFANDVLLLTLEPALFRDVAWVSQRLVLGAGSCSGTVLTMTSQDVLFDAGGVDTGNVVLVAGTGYEVIARVSGTVLTISRLRASDDDALTPVSGASDVEVSVPTFAPQIAMVHRQVLRMIGIEPDVPEEAGSIGPSAIVNPGALARVEALGALHLIYAAAGSALGPESAPARKAEFYRQRFADERQRAVAMIDTDADGQPDAVRRLNILALVRG